MPTLKKRLNIAYVMQNVGVDMARDIGQSILIKHTINGLERAGHHVSLLALDGRQVTGMDESCVLLCMLYVNYVLWGLWF